MCALLLLLLVVMFVDDAAVNIIWGVYLYVVDMMYNNVCMIYMVFSSVLIRVTNYCNSGTFGQFWLPMCWFCLFYLAIVLATFVVFKKNRTVPFCFVGYLTLFDWFVFLHEVIRGMNFTSNIYQKSSGSMWHFLKSIT